MGIRQIKDNRAIRILMFSPIVIFLYVGLVCLIYLPAAIVLAFVWLCHVLACLVMLIAYPYLYLLGKLYNKDNLNLTKNELIQLLLPPLFAWSFICDLFTQIYAGELGKPKIVGTRI